MITKEERGRQASVNGFAHEQIALGILMKKYRNVSKVNLPLSSYDLIIVLKDDKGIERIIRCQVKTAKKQISFIGGSRGGVDRTYKSDVKVYKQSRVTSDVIIGITPTNGNRFDLYFLPTILVEVLNQSGISINKVQGLKNNFDILERCNDPEYVINACRDMGIIH